MRAWPVTRALHEVAIIRRGIRIRSVGRLNALTQGLPVVSTSLGCEGIAVEAGRHVLLADTPKQFAAAVLRLFNDPRLGRRLGENGRRLMVERPTKEMIMQTRWTVQNETIYSVRAMSDR